MTKTETADVVPFPPPSAASMVVFEVRKLFTELCGKIEATNSTPLHPAIAEDIERIAKLLDVDRGREALAKMRLLSVEAFTREHAHRQEAHRDMLTWMESMKGLLDRRMTAMEGRFETHTRWLASDVSSVRGSATRAAKAATAASKAAASILRALALARAKKKPDASAKAKKVKRK